MYPIANMLFNSVMTKTRNDEDEAFAGLAEPMIKKMQAEMRRAEQRSDGSYDNKLNKDEVTRDNNEKAERARLDNHRCVVLGTGNAEICHIIPFSANSKDEYRVRFRKYFGSALPCMFSDALEQHDDSGDDSGDSSGDDEMDLDSEDLDPLTKFTLQCRDVFASKPGISDRAWNQISLNRQLHKWWSEGFLAFEPLYIDYDFTFKGDTPSVGAPKTFTRIKLQFHWMPRRKDLGSEAPTLEISKKSQNREALSSILGKTYGDLDPANPVFAENRQISICHHLQTGDIFYVNVEYRCADRMLAAFKLQWATIMIYSIAGGAESLKDVGDHPDYLDENLEWLGCPLPTIADLLLEMED
jgi:hypothetical protein